MRTIAILVACAVACGRVPSLEAQFLKHVTERVKEKAAEKKAQTEESVLTRATEPADSALSKVAAPVESLAAKVGEGAGAAVAGLGRGQRQAEEQARLQQELATGRAALPAVQFSPGGDDIDPSSEPSLRVLAAVIAGSPSVYLIQARADAGTSPQIASEMGSARATAVKTWLMGNGIPAAQVFAAGDGAAIPDGPLVSVVLMQ
jgi:outer membrane protein OmpA-like peptidoglycan-associated protein